MIRRIDSVKNKIMRSILNEYQSCLTSVPAICVDIKMFNPSLYQLHNEIYESVENI